MKRDALWLLGTLAFAVHAAEPATLKLAQTIPLLGVKGRFDHFALDPAGKHLFVAAPGNNTLEGIDLAYDADRKRLYLSCGEGFIDVVDQHTPDTCVRVSQMATAPGLRTR